MTSTLALPRRHWVAAIERAPLADSTKKKYRRAIERYLATGGLLTDPDALSDYVELLPASSRAFLKAALKLITDQLATTLKAQVTPETLAQVQAVLYRIDALNKTITVSAPKGQAAQIWLSIPEVEALLATCDDSLAGQRDRLALALLVAAGLRRQEAVELVFSNVQTQPVHGFPRQVLDIQGKGARKRVVPISEELAELITAWAKIVDGEGLVLRSVRGSTTGDSLTAQALFDIVRRHGVLIDKPDLAPHDLRRTYAQIGYENGIPVAQIKTLLGHASIATTQRYLNLDVNLDLTISDLIPISL